MIFVILCCNINYNVDIAVDDRYTPCVDTQFISYSVVCNN